MGTSPRLCGVSAAPRTVARPPIQPHCDGGFMRMRRSDLSPVHAANVEERGGSPWDMLS